MRKEDEKLENITGLTIEELMGLFVEGSYQLADAYGITGREGYFKTAEQLIAVRNRIIQYVFDQKSHLKKPEKLNFL